MDSSTADQHLSTSPGPANQPPAIAPLHQIVLKLIASLPGYPKLRALELSCGDGVVLQQLTTAGVQAVGTTFLAADDDYIRHRPYPAGLNVMHGVDLNKRLPFEDGTFDLIYSTEVIEHVESHANFIAESARVLRKGGWFVITAPNTHRLLSRVHHLLSGMLEIKRQLIPWDQAASDMYAYHHRCPDFTVMHWLMWVNGLRIKDAKETLILWPSRWLYLAAPLLRAASHRLGQRRSGKNIGDPEPSALDQVGRADMLRWLNSRPGMVSEQWCLLAQKQE